MDDVDGREGGTVRISLTYVVLDRVGKSAGRTDIYRGRFASRAERAAEVRNLVATHEALPAAVSPEDNQTGWRHTPA